MLLVLKMSFIISDSTPFYQTLVKRVPRTVPNASQLRIRLSKAVVSASSDKWEVLATEGQFSNKIRRNVPACVWICLQKLSEVIAWFFLVLASENGWNSVLLKMNCLSCWVLCWQPVTCKKLQRIYSINLVYDNLANGNFCCFHCFLPQNLI